MYMYDSMYMSVCTYVGEMYVCMYTWQCVQV